MTTEHGGEEQVAGRGSGDRPGADGSTPRTLAEDLRTRSDEALAALLRVRPDLVTPVPGDLTGLATRAGTRTSVVRALERLDLFTVQTAEALAVAADPCPYPDLLRLMAGDPPRPDTADGDGPPDAAGGGPPETGAGEASGDGEEPEGTAEDVGPPAGQRAGWTGWAGYEEVAAALPGAVAALRTHALVWGAPDRLRLVRTARELLAPAPATPSATGLGPTLTEAAAGMSPGRAQEILADAGLPPTHDPVSAMAALRELFTDRERMAALLATADPGAAAVLAKLVWGPPYGEVARAGGRVRADAADTPVRWLLARGLLLPAGPRTVVLPREVALHLRGGRAHRRPQPRPPLVRPAAAHPVETVDGTAAGEAFTAVRTVAELLSAWQAGGPPVLRAGGLSVRELRRTAALLDVPEPRAGFWVELAYTAGLLASDGEADEAFAPTPAYDAWLALPVAGRWAALATAWLAGTRTAGLIGTRDARGRVLAALGPGLDRSAAPELRGRVLRLLADLPKGSSAAEDSLLARLRWERPQRGAGGLPATAADALTGGGPGSVPGGAAGSGPGGERDGGPVDPRARLVRWCVEEAELLGVTGRGALASYAREALAGDGFGAVAGRLAKLLPRPLDHVLLQADLTAVAPGPLHTPLAEFLGVAAEVESKGGATVYRFTPASVRRALDAGQTADDLHAFLAAHSRTPVPQPLGYLIDDIARRHGRLRVGAASAYLRCDDEAALTELLADRRTAALGLRRLAPTVLAARADPVTVLARLREMGLAPAAESAEGDVLITRPDARRTPPRTAPAPVPDGPPVPGDPLLAAAVRAIRAGDRAATAAVRAPVPARRPGGDGPGGDAGAPRSGTAETLATVQAAVLTGEPLWIGYVNADGAASQRVIEPVRVEGGFVTAYDRTAEAVRRYALHRITGVRELADESP